MHLSDAPISFLKTMNWYHLNSPATPSAFPPMLRPTKPYVPRLGGDVMIFFNETLSSPFFAGRLSYSVNISKEIVSFCALAHCESHVQDQQGCSDHQCRYKRTHNDVLTGGLRRAAGENIGVRKRGGPPTICGLEIRIFAQGAIVCA